MDKQLYMRHYTKIQWIKVIEMKVYTFFDSSMIPFGHCDVINTSTPRNVGFPLKQRSHNSCTSFVLK